MFQILQVPILTLLFLPLIKKVNGARLNTTTILPSLPDGFSNHGNPGLLCMPAKWSDVAIFYFGNYVAHAATVKALPGESTLGAIFAIIAALLFPITGVIRGFKTIYQSAITAKTELQTAARAGALCTVVRQDASYDIPRDHNNKSISLLMTRIHGSYALPKGYWLTVVGPNAKFENDPEPVKGTWWQNLTNKVGSQFKPLNRNSTSLACNYSFVKVGISLGQSLFAIATLYQTRGDQIIRFGYAAFGLTVTPYAFMSIVNLCGSLVCPEYPEMYLVESQAMREIMQMGTTIQENGLVKEINEQEEDNCERGDKETIRYEFQGIVGKLDPEYESLQTELRSLTSKNLAPAPAVFQKKMESRRSASKSESLIQINKPALLSALPIIGLVLATSAVLLGIIGGLTNFKNGSSTQAQRGWTMAWLSFGILMGYEMDLLKEKLESRQRLNYQWYTNSQTLAYVFSRVLIFSVPAIGGFVVVGQMLLDYGSCISVG
ncbi:hypothetical protein AOQ84DRAFT_393104 [Glonium stellatum]|uniref:Uncharacterized protein n=1 Tax=Glonium stellatum TaxID=574774 RepID=A0A8E2JMK3_9PEZI|nr:hypothetical protein AOQ84DRAFT_393104 [Glonium stellatum]